jgi:hypothetical protein
MACCAFVAFLVSQVYVMIQALTHWMRRTRDVQVPSAVMWRLDQPVPVSEPEPLVSLAHAPLAHVPRSKRRTSVLISLAVAAELAIMIGGVQWLRTGGAQALMIDAERLASVRSIAELQIVCTARRIP